MNYLQVFSNPEFGQVRTEQQELKRADIKVLFVNGKPKYVIITGLKMDQYQLLAFANEFSDFNKDDAWSIMNFASSLFHPENDWAFNTLYGAVAMDMTRKSMSENREYWLHDFFNNNVSQILGQEAKIVKVKQNSRHQPDSWVQVDDNILPVEIKNGPFDNKALRQLTRYIKFYNSKGGVAVGNELAIKLPSNIRFYNCSNWREQSREVRREQLANH